MAEKNQDKREEYIFMAKLAEQTERFEDMVDYMKKVLELSKDSKDSKELNEEQRNLLSIAYKNSVGQRRTAWRAIVAFELKEKQKPSNTKFTEPVSSYKLKIEEELNKICSEILQTIDVYLKNRGSPKDRAFYLKMKGDYNRYLAELQGNQTQQYIAQAEMGYREALAILDDKSQNQNQPVSKTDPLRLGIALNYSVFYYEIKSNIQEACTIAKNAFDDAIQELETIDEELYKDATTILQLIKDNLTTWTNELTEV